uniref:G_PROTEIN_RECEP_F1_2 domain-containing protein n=1 Tax=Rhabditophanes sp. KR3021 TaxID=114890 RepID=A0AC35TNY3_9BILA
MSTFNENISMLASDEIFNSGDDNIEIMELFGNKSQCQDLRTFLWETEHDYTTQNYVIIPLSIIYSIVILIAVIGNVFVITAIIRNRTLQSVRNFFIMSLSCSDILVCAVSGFITPITAFNKTWLFGHLLCKLVPFISGVSLFFSTYTLAAISADRFVLIVFPTREPLTKRHSGIMILFNLLVGILFSLPIYIESTLQTYEAFCGQICNEQWLNNDAGRKKYGTIIFFAQIVVPFVIISACYLMISIKLKKGLFINSGTTDKDLPKSDVRKIRCRRRLRTNRMLMAMIIVFIGCQAPSVAFNAARDHQILPEFMLRQNYLFGLITHLCSITATIFNFVLYALLNLQFRNAFTQIIEEVPILSWMNMSKINDNDRLQYNTMKLSRSEQKVDKKMTKASCKFMSIENQLIRDKFLGESSLTSS